MSSFVMPSLNACNEAFTTNNGAEQTEYAALLIGTMALSVASRSDAVYIEALQADNETLQTGNTVLQTDNAPCSVCIVALSVCNASMQAAHKALLIYDEALQV
ncbi:hypothetical protein [Candidatus Electronema sp. PJ]|uniref:hypothetical protein n=1 Tax=Candidatus Electronema sp. PJ TaxID=3401572 RepID=UPI003AA98D81